MRLAGLRDVAHVGLRDRPGVSGQLYEEIGKSILQETREVLIDFDIGKLVTR